MPDLKIIILVDLLSNTFLFVLNLGRTEVISTDFSKIFLLLFVDTLGTVPYHHSAHP